MHNDFIDVEKYGRLSYACFTFSWDSVSRKRSTFFSCSDALAQDQTIYAQCNYCLIIMVCEHDLLFQMSVLRSKCTFEMEISHD